MMFIYIKQHLSNIWSSIHEKVKQYRGWIEKSVAYKKTCNPKTEKHLVLQKFVEEESSNVYKFYERSKFE